ncbi:hypothetical protein, partial [uncultured Rhodospira sp.]|uniref:hypothetical protein n=1 Tax=uncultured Rhodospira sp. TaxID=1936189 RepID=UPI002639750E
MHDALYQEIGRIAASWVAIEDMIDELLSHYIGVDRHVTAIVIEGMRGIDKEAVLRRLTSKKESDPIILREIENSLRACGLIRQYRNAILHRGIPGTASDYGLFVSWIGAVRAAIDEFCHYFSELVAVVSEALTLRAMVADSEDLDG